MLSNLTPAVVRALESSRRFALRANTLEPLHLLHGLLAEEEGRAVELALQAGLQWSCYQQTRGEAEEARELSLSPATESILYLARELSFELAGEGMITSEAVLLALVRQGAGVAPYLSQCGMDCARLESLLSSQRPAGLPLVEPLHLADQTEQMDVARILDANLNRAREGLRVVEDHCRFCLADAFLAEQLKALRHELTTAFEEQGPRGLLEARETQTDVGTHISLADERERLSLGEVVQANLKRAQEALRTLEEYAKLSSAGLAERLEQCRYRCYTLERAVLLGAGSRQYLQEVRLCVLLTTASCASGMDWIIGQVAEGGAGMVQLREKGLTDRELLARARQVRKWTRRAGVLFIVNDRPDIARLVEADGVHLGQDDLSVHEARRLVGPDLLIGVSTHHLDQVRQAVLDGANYLGIGPVFASQTKQFSEFPGVRFVEQALAETSLPAFAIGGINLQNVHELAARGVKRVAVSHLLASAEDPRAVAKQLLEALG